MAEFIELPSGFVALNTLVFFGILGSPLFGPLVFRFWTFGDFKHIFQSQGFHSLNAMV